MGFPYNTAHRRSQGPTHDGADRGWLQISYRPKGRKL